MLTAISLFAVPASAQHPDFNGDGRADLAIGTPDEAILTSVDGFVAGAVNVLFGSASGITAAADQLWSQDAGGILDLYGGRRGSSSAAPALVQTIVTKKLLL